MHKRPDTRETVLLALELLPRSKPAETLVQRRLREADVEPAVRLAYVRALTQQQRLGEAADQLRQVTAQQPKMAGPWLTLGAIELDLKHHQEAEAALQRYLDLTARPADDVANANGEDTAEGRVQARLLLAQAFLG